MRSIAHDRSEPRRFLRRAFVFVLIGLGLYAVLYVAAEALVGRYAERNRFYTVQAADRERYDFVILGASHAAVFDYRDLNSELERAAGGNVLNLATLGGGLTVNRLLLEYFFEEHETEVVVYVLDSFAFYSPSWNEERLRDTELFVRAPWDPTLARLLLSRPEGRAVAFDYITGFSKINNPNRFEPDSFPGEGSGFERPYRPVRQIDRQRVDFLYPDGADPSSATARRYLADLEELIGYARSQAARFVVVRPPIPERMQSMIPAERQFDVVLTELLERLDVPHFDFSNAIPEEELYYDSDHLNREGALRFLHEHLGPALAGVEP